MLLNLSPFSGLLGLKRKLKSFSCGALMILFILCFLIESNKAGVIKNPETNKTETPSGNTVVGSQETEVELSISTQPHNASVATFNTKLQIVDGTSLVTETSKELTNNEISINEANKLMNRAEIIKPTINETLITTNSEGNNAKDNSQDLQQISQTLENKPDKLEEPIKGSNEFSSNDIKEEKILKLKENPYENSNQKENKAKDNENSGFLEKNVSSKDNNPKVANENEVNGIEKQNPLTFKESENHNPNPTSKLLTELETVTEKSVIKTKSENKPLDNSIENSKEYLGLTLVNKTATISREENALSPIELTTLKALTNSEDKMLETVANIFSIKLGESLPKAVETSTSVSKETESLKVFNENSIVPFKDSNKVNQIKSSANNSNTQNETKQTPNSLAKEEETILSENTKKMLISTEETLPRPKTNNEDLLVFEGDKKEYARSMFMEDVTTLKTPEQNEELLREQVTTFQPVKLSIKEGIKEFTPNVKKEEQDQVLNKTHSAAFNMKEKKPKFINDNSTNAQQLNLPNNAEVWSLAAMKSLPKSNITMETAHAHNETLQEFKTQQNTSTITNNNSEKSLLDWSQIMMDKDLAITTRNEETEATERNDKNILEKEISLLTEKPEEEVITKNSLLEQEPFTTNTMPPVLATNTILSFSKNNENLHLADKKVEENMNNHIETLTATFASTNVVDNNPFNTLLNIEPNINDINLTSNQTKVDLNNEVHTTNKTTTAGNPTTKDDVKANVYIEAETSTQSAEATTWTKTEMPATTISTLSTTATAVYDDLTTVEPISSETTTVSILETAKQNASLKNVVISEQRKQQQAITNKTYNVNKEETNSDSHNELDNNVLDKNQFNQNKNSDSITKTITTTTTVIPITTFRPTILAITSKAETFEQETDQKNNEIQTKPTNTQQPPHSVIKFDLQQLNNTTTTIVYETTTLQTLTTPSTATEHLTTTETTSKNANSHTSSPWENDSTTPTSYSKDVIINETTELNLNFNEQTTTQTTPKQKNEHNNEGVNEEETATGSAVLVDKKFENKEYQNTTTETNFLASTSTETPVVLITEKDQEIFESLNPTTDATTSTPTTTTAFTQSSIISTTTEQLKIDTEENILKGKDQEKDVLKATTTTTTKAMNNTQETTTISSSIISTTLKEEETYISLLDDTTTTTIAATIQPHSTTIASVTHTTTTNLSTPSSFSSSTLPSPITTKIEEIYNVINSTTTEVIQTTTQQLLTEIAEDSTSSSSPESASSSSTTTITHLTEMLPTATTPSSQMMPTNDMDRSSLPTLTAIMGGNSGNMYTKNSQASGETDVNVIIAITVSVIGVIALILLVGFLYLMRKRQKQTSYSQRCRPVSLDDYTIDNASVGGSMRKGSALRASKRTYGNLAFDDPTLRHNPMGVHELAKFVQEKLRIFEEFRDVPQITSRLDEVPTGCEDKNRYANVLPLPETRVILERLNDDEKSEYINANYVTGPKDPPNYYIACQAPLESTVEDFWRMIWEQQSRVIIQATDLIEIGVEKCAEYLPPSVTLDNHSSFGDFQITLQNREVKDKYAISTLLLKHVTENATRELTHYWYKWPEVGVPTEEAPIIAMLLEARSSLISYAIEQANEDKEKSSVATLKSAEEGTVTTTNSTTLPTNNSNGSSANDSTGEINGNISMVHVKKAARNQGPLTIHCSPGTGRTGTIIACDIALRSLETPKRIVDIPQIVYSVRRGRASAVLTKEQYEFIYKVANMYAAKITNPTNYN